VRRPVAADDVGQNEEDDEDPGHRQQREHDERVGEADREEGAAAKGREKWELRRRGNGEFFVI